MIGPTDSLDEHSIDCMFMQVVCRDGEGWTP